MNKAGWPLGKVAFMHHLAPIACDTMLESLWDSIGPACRQSWQALAREVTSEHERRLREENPPAFPGKPRAIASVRDRARGLPATPPQWSVDHGDYDEGGAAGFGIVVDPAHLTELLRAYQAGGDCDPDALNVLRMQAGE